MYIVEASTSECLSELDLDELRAGELPQAEAQRCREHLAACAACRDKQLALQQADAALYAAAPSFDALRTLVGPRRPTVMRRKRVWAAPLAALGLAALAFVALRPGLQPRAAYDTRAKGAPRLGFYVERAGAVHEGQSGETVRPGDGLRFVYSIDRPYYFALLSRDARALSVYFPEAEHALKLVPGQKVALDFSVELDDAPGAERVIGFFCPQSFAVEEARAALVATSLPPAFAACHRATLELNKAP